MDGVDNLLITFKRPKVFSNISDDEVKASSGVMLPLVQISKIKLSNSKDRLLRDVSTKKLTFVTGMKTASTAKKRSGILESSFSLVK